MTKCMPRGLRRAMVVIAALGLSSLSIASAQATASSTFLTLAPTQTTFVKGSSYSALVIGFGNGAPTGDFSLDPADLSGIRLNAAGAGNPIAAGLAHTCALAPSSGVQCWGSGASGQLGDGLGQDSTTPVDVAGVSGAIAVSAASLHTCALLATGGVTCWGNNFGLAPVAIPSITDARAISANGDHTCAVLATGGVKCWGLNTSGQLGDGSTQSSSEPVDVIGLGSAAVTVAAGFTHTCATTQTAVKCWGSNAHGKLGAGDSIGPMSSTPVDVVGLSGDFLYLAAGENHTCAARLQGVFDTTSLRCWGDNSLGQLGTDDKLDRSTPIPVNVDYEVWGLYAGRAHNCAVNIFGDIRCWGANANGQIGNGQTANAKPWPILMQEPETLPQSVSVPALGGQHTCALMKTGMRKCWGDNSQGQYGNGLVQSQKTPLDIAAQTFAVFGKVQRPLRAAAGTHTLRAYFLRGNYDPSSSNEITLVVEPSPTTLTLTASANPSTLGQPVTFTAKVTPVGATGTVELWEGTQLLATTPFGSQASISISHLMTGGHTITAIATVDGGNLIAPPPASLQQTVLRAPTRTTLSASPSVVGMGKPVTLVASVAEVGTSNGPITGSVTFKHNGTGLGTVAVSSGIATLNVGTWPIGTQTFTAAYSGSATFQPSIGSGATTIDPTVGAPAEVAGATGGLGGSFRMPASARLPSGRFVVATFLQGRPILSSGTYFQQYTSLGQPVGGITRVKPMLAVDGVYPKVAATGTGFVVVYNWRQYIDGPQRIMAQRYSAAGAKVGAEFQVNATNPGHITQHQVAKLADGGFVVVWGAGNSGEIYARRYDSRGAPVGGEFIVNTTLLKTQTDPAVAALANGGFVIAWSTQAGAGYEIYAQRYAANGRKLGVELKLTTSPGMSENVPVIAGLHNGGFVAAWSRSSNADATVRGRRYTAAGAPNGAEFVIGGQNAGHWEPITLAVLDDDRFLVAYAKTGANFSANIYAKLLAPTAADDAATGEFRLSSTGGLRPSAVALSNRNMFVLWETNRMRRLDFPPVP
jgi:alpha-tubulin suppressor-like RCC1 family protein